MEAGFKKRRQSVNEGLVGESRPCAHCTLSEDEALITMIIAHRLRKEHPEWSPMRVRDRARIDFMKGKIDGQDTE